MKIRKNIKKWKNYKRKTSHSRKSTSKKRLHIIKTSPNKLLNKPNSLNPLVPPTPKSSPSKPSAVKSSRSYRSTRSSACPAHTSRAFNITTTTVPRPARSTSMRKVLASIACLTKMESYFTSKNLGITLLFC